MKDVLAISDKRKGAFKQEKSSQFSRDNREESSFLSRSCPSGVPRARRLLAILTTRRSWTYLDSKDLPGHKCLFSNGLIFTHYFCTLI